MNKEENEFSRDKINAFLSKLLENKESVTVGEIPIETDADFFRLVLIQIYSQYEEMCYQIEYNQEIQSIYGYSMQSFNIVRKRHDTVSTGVLKFQ